ncbi:aromatic amino acid lyase [Streptomyces chattanoogensis]|uniref:aromatic amino acid lyase n=1 Tax=Streptomyces chattanoogensis TaxID=66876 RepID=UPI0036C15BCB
MREEERRAPYHHGGFHLARLGLAIDQFRLGLLGTAELSTTRLGILVEPAFTGLPPFLAEDEDGSSGIMITEYAAQSALAELRGAAQPVTLGHAVISRGVEEHASFASTGARRLLESVEHFRLVLACELVAAVRALRMRGLAPAGDGELRDFHARAAQMLDPSLADRNLTADIEAAAALLAAA